MLLQLNLADSMATAQQKMLVDRIIAGAAEGSFTIGPKVRIRTLHHLDKVQHLLPAETLEQLRSKSTGQGPSDEPSRKEGCKADSSNPWPAKTSRLSQPVPAQRPLSLHNHRQTPLHETTFLLPCATAS